MATRVVLGLGEPFDTGETCPMCLFDAVRAVLVLVDGRNPRFMYFCGRKCGRIEEN